MAKANFKTRWLLAGLLCLTFWLTPGATYGQSRELVEAQEELLDASKRYRTLYSQARYSEALPFAKKVVRFAEQVFGPDHPDFATSLNSLAELYRLRGCYAEAEPLYKRALAIDEIALGPDHPGLATDLNGLALLYHAMGRNAEI